jgi:WD40 repeat protein
MTEESLFHEALTKTNAQERAAFLDAACAGRPELRAGVEALLAAHAASVHPLDQPAQPAATGEHTPIPDQGPTAVYVPGDVEAGLLIVGRYTLVEKIGEGGMGEVWVAKQTEPVKRKVALKLLKPGMDSRSVIQRFEQERQALALMDHPNIARVLDGGLTQGRQPFFVMELVNGLGLTKFCDQAKLSIRERLELFVQVCQAVQHAHQKGIVHRDLKPSNILVTLIDGKAIPKIIDFGVAKAVGGKLIDESLSTQFGAVIGTVEYMAPEQASFSGADVDTRADIYSLGAILYELLTGLRPFDSKRLRKAAFDEMIRMVREGEPSKPSTRLSTDDALPSLAALRQMEPGRLTKLLRGELDWVVMKCLEKHRDRRYETASGLARDVQRYLADEPVEARPPSAGYRLKKFVRRNRGPVVAALVVLLVLVAGIAGTTLGLLRAEQSRVEAVAAQEAEAQERKTAETSAQQARETGHQLRIAKDELLVNLYAARSNLIQAAWEARGVTRMRELLEEQKPKAGEQDFRGFEWHYWDRRAHAELTIGPAASEYERARVEWRVLSPDGRLQAISWGSHQNEKGDLAFSKIEVRDTLSGAELTSFQLSIPFLGQRGTHPRLSFTADSTALFITWLFEPEAGGQAKLHWWLFEAATGKELVPHQEAACASIPSSTLGTDRTLVAVPQQVLGPPKGVRLNLFTLATGKQGGTCAGTFSAIHRVAFRPDGKEVAAAVSTTVAEKPIVKVWDTATGRERLTLAGGPGYVQQLSWSPDGRRLALVTRELRVWDSTDGHEVLALAGSDGFYQGVVFSPDGARLACIDPFTPSRFIILRDTSTGRIRTTLLQPEEHFFGVAFSADGTRLVTLARFGTIRTWDATTNELPIELSLPVDFPLAREGIVWSTSLSADGTRVAAAGPGKNQETAGLQVWDGRGQSICKATRPCRRSKHWYIPTFYHVAFSPDGRRAAWWFGPAGGAPDEPERPGDHRLLILDVPSGEELWSLDPQRVNGAVQFSPDGRWLITHVRPLNDDKEHPAGAIKILDVESGREVHSLLSGNLHFATNGKLLVGLGAADTNAGLYPLRVWDLQAGTEIPAGSYPADLLDTPGVMAAALSPDGTRLALLWGGRETGGKIRMLEVPSGRELPPLGGAEWMMSVLAFNPDGSRLAAAGVDVRIWDTNSSQELITLRDAQGSVADLGFIQDGKRLRALVRLGGNYAVKTWDATPRATK